MTTAWTVIGRLQFLADFPRRAGRI